MAGARALLRAAGVEKEDLGRKPIIAVANSFTEFVPGHTHLQPVGRIVSEAMGVAPERFCMVGNTVRSDVLPVLALGGHAVQVPYEITWGHEESLGHGQDFPVLPNLTAFAEWVATSAAG